MGILPDAIRPSMQGVLNTLVATVAADGTPNVIYVSQLWYVDADHVALSRQFFGKTTRNLADNPRAFLICLDPTTLTTWELDAEFVRSETEGPVFEEMAMQLELIASMTGMGDVFRLHSADVLRVTRVVECPLPG